MIFEKEELNHLLDKFGVQDIIFDLISSLSAVKSLSEIDGYFAGDEKELVLNALNVLIDNQDMERCSFYLLDEAQYLVNLTGLSSDEHASGKILKHYKPAKFKVGEGIIGMAAKTCELQVCNDCKKDPHFQDIQKPRDCFPGSIISVPVFAENQLLGVLNISHPEPNYFTDWHIRLLQIYKNMLGQLITNCRLFQKMEKQIAKRTEELEKTLKSVEQLKDHYENQAMIDDMTGLFNRRYFYIQAERAIANTIRYGQMLCLLIIDIDFFKKLNDSFGHQGGDEVLNHVAAILKSQVRDSDILVRFGGEEFVIIFTDTTCRNGEVFAERIRETIEQSECNYKGDCLKTTVSIGVYCLNQSRAKKDRDDIDAIINRADLALYRAKETGRNKVVVFTPSLLQKNKQLN